MISKEERMYFDYLLIFYNLLKDQKLVALVKSENEVYIIDSGSFQIADYSCDVFTRGWTDKNYRGDDFERIRKN